MKKLIILLLTVLFITSCSIFSPNTETRRILLEAGTKLGSYTIDEYGGPDGDEYAYGKAIIVEGSDILIILSDDKTMVGVNIYVDANLISTMLKDMSIMIYDMTATGNGATLTVEIDKTSFTLGAILPWSMKDTIKKLYDMEIEDWKWIATHGLQNSSTNNL